MYYCTFVNSNVTVYGKYKTIKKQDWSFPCFLHLLDDKRQILLPFPASCQIYVFNNKKLCSLTFVSLWYCTLQEESKRPNFTLFYILLLSICLYEPHFSFLIILILSVPHYLTFSHFLHIYFILISFTSITLSLFPTTIFQSCLLPPHVFSHPNPFFCSISLSILLSLPCLSLPLRC